MNIIEINKFWGGVDDFVASGQCIEISVDRPDCQLILTACSSCGGVVGSTIYQDFDSMLMAVVNLMVSGAEEGKNYRLSMTDGYGGRIKNQDALDFLLDIHKVVFTITNENKENGDEM